MRAFTFFGWGVDGSKHKITLGVTAKRNHMGVAVAEFMRRTDRPEVMCWRVASAGCAPLTGWMTGGWQHTLKNTYPVTAERWGRAFEGVTPAKST